MGKGGVPNPAAALPGPAGARIVSRETNIKGDRRDRRRRTTGWRGAARDGRHAADPGRGRRGRSVRPRPGRAGRRPRRDPDRADRVRALPAPYRLSVLANTVSRGDLATLYERPLRPVWSRNGGCWRSWRGSSRCRPNDVLPPARRWTRCGSSRAVSRACRPRPGAPRRVGRAGPPPIGAVADPRRAAPMHDRIHASRPGPARRRSWPPLTPGEDPTGLVPDPADHRLQAAAGPPRPPAPPQSGPEAGAPLARKAGSRPPPLANCRARGAGAPCYNDVVTDFRMGIRPAAGAAGVPGRGPGRRPIGEVSTVRPMAFGKRPSSSSTDPTST